MKNENYKTNGGKNMKNKCKAHDSIIECKKCEHNTEHDISLRCLLRCCEVPGKNVRCVRTDL